MSSGTVCAGAPVDYDADFVYGTWLLYLKYLLTSKEMEVGKVKGTFCGVTDYYTLRVGGLIFAGVIVVLSVLLLAGTAFKKHWEVAVWEWIYTAGALYPSQSPGLFKERYNSNYLSGKSNCYLLFSFFCRQQDFQMWQFQFQGKKKQKQLTYLRHLLAKDLNNKHLNLKSHRSVMLLSSSTVKAGSRSVIRIQAGTTRALNC